MTISPNKTVLNIMIGAKLRNISKNKKIFSWNSLILNFESDAVKLLLTFDAMTVRASTLWALSAFLKVKCSIPRAHCMSSWLLIHVELGWHVRLRNLAQSPNLIHISIEASIWRSVLRPVITHIWTLIPSSRRTGISSSLESLLSLFSQVV
jgi:hypothetical protein